MNSSCTCRQPHSWNILKNAGVDGSISNWTGNAAYNGSNDAEGCMGSGSILIERYTDSFHQCLTTGYDKNTTWVFGFLYKALTSAPQDAYCTFSTYTNTNCTGFIDGGNTQVTSVGTWVPGTVPFTIPGTTGSIDVSCAAVSGAGYYDHMFLSPSNQATY